MPPRGEISHDASVAGAPSLGVDEVGAAQREVARARGRVGEALRAHGTRGARELEGHDGVRDGVRGVRLGRVGGCAPGTAAVPWGGLAATRAGAVGDAGATLGLGATLVIVRVLAGLATAVGAPAVPAAGPAAGPAAEPAAAAAALPGSTRAATTAVAAVRQARRRGRTSDARGRPHRNDANETEEKDDASARGVGPLERAA